MSTTERDASEPPHERRRGLRALAVVVALVVVAVVAWRVYEWEVEAGTPPAFYSPPSNLPADSPGTVLRTQTVSSSQPGRRVWRVLYESTGLDGKPIAVSGTIAYGPAPAPFAGRPIVAWAHGTSGVVPACAPSLDRDGGLGRVPGVEQVLASGAVVVATDYPGLGTPGIHPYLVGESEGRAVLDSVRAARIVTGETVNDVVVYGHSQGGHATLFAAQLAPTYAPELHLVGVAPMAPPTNLAALLKADSTECAGILLTALAVTSWSTIYPDAHEDAVVHPEAKPFIHKIADRCIADDAEIADIPDILALKARFLSTDPATAPGWSPIFPPNSPGPAALKVPVLVAQGLADTIVRPDVTQAYVQQQCAAGASIEYDTYAKAGHFQVRTAAAPDVVAWLLARTAGTPAPPGCSTEARG
jgi:pimeloyl-ACP methyl ester carboxylesterase